MNCFPNRIIQLIKGSGSSLKLYYFSATSPHILIYAFFIPNLIGDNKICSGSRDNSVRLWDIETGNCLANMGILRNLVTQMKWVPGKTAVAQTSEDKSLRYVRYGLVIE